MDGKLARDGHKVKRISCRHVFYQPLDGSALPFGGSIAKYCYFGDLSES
jgi:hypothetical protein